VNFALGYSHPIEFLILRGYRLRWKKADAPDGYQAPDPAALGKFRPTPRAAVRRSVQGKEGIRITGERL